MNLVISGSSYLLPNNKAWRPLQAKAGLVFADYGAWATTLLQADPLDSVAIVLFLDDLVDVRTHDEAEARGVLDGFLKVLRSRLVTARNPTIVAFASCDTTTVVQSARHASTASRLHAWFLGEAYALAEEHGGLSIVDLDRLFGTIGVGAALDTRNWYVAHCRVSSRGLACLADALARILHRHLFAAAKVLVLDCDNTLWGGVVGEDGLENLLLGQDGVGRAFVDFQAAAKALSREGILLALASKNNESDILEVFDRHRSMVLSRTDFVAWKINWQDKALSLREIASDLDLGLDAIVFWDDNPMERDRVRQTVPEVLTVDVPVDVSEWPRHLVTLDCFARFAITPDDTKRTRQYHSRARFLHDKAGVVDMTGYLKSIRLKPLAHALTPSLLARAAQLCGKTNQFNLRSIRHTSVELASLAEANPDLCFLTSLEDVYGDHGFVGLVCLREVSEDVVFLDTLLMSCRVLGRHLESWMLARALTVARKHGYKSLLGEFIPSNRNQVAARFFEEHGFALLTTPHDGGETAVAPGNASCDGTARLYSSPTDPRPLPNLSAYGDD